jgi:hypothetical protein
MLTIHISKKCCVANIWIRRWIKNEEIELTKSSKDDSTKPHQAMKVKKSTPLSIERK